MDKESSIRRGRLLLVSTLIFVAITLVLPYLPFVSVFGFIPLPAPLMLAMLGLTALYVLVTELAKKFFYSRAGNGLAWARFRRGMVKHCPRPTRVGSVLLRCAQGATVCSIPEGFLITDEARPLWLRLSSKARDAVAVAAADV